MNGFNKTKINNWELFFEQPFNYKLEDVIKNAKTIVYLNDSWRFCGKWPDQRVLPFTDVEKYYWHHFANKYLSIKKELIELSKKIMYRLFKSSKNILGVLIRGTDYVAMRPIGHPIQPNLTDIIRDVKRMDKKYIYDYIFFSTEDEIIKEKFSKIFHKKVKYIKSRIKINYDYSKKVFIAYNNKIKDYIEYNKLYLYKINFYFYN